ncbi:hypothetical protein SAMN04487829_1655 [Pseudobutyrivibrio sp. NOR37]|uniref:Uncharacterized protein n=1 Tax=Pseudobutyrivibrio xylanivorans TaxID=185007 RepID=A0A6M0LJL4_PSEXY|nr:MULTISPECIES: hypothetical protein [Pseudobutyrivibrio]NEX02047.1 hypothetical protein [Pseudobutyrivibrio xylanivorans]SFR73879.1 hypothetical protein SAMN04487829_1655 [Pseudobutyrivibrio sp. NOR37]
MDENAKKIQREIAKDKIQIILASIALAILIIMEFYIMINFKSNFMAMAIGVLLMIVVLFFLISGVMDISLKQKDMETQKYEDIYNAQKASYLVIKKSFDEMEQRLRAIEENSSLPAEDIINAQKAVAKVTISRSKENTDALMNSNDELINQLVSIQEKLESNNTQILEKQQSLLKENNFDIQQKIAAITNQLSSLEGRIQGGMSAMAAQPVQMAAPVMPEVQEPVQTADMPVMEEAIAEDIPLDMDIEVPAEEPVAEEAPVEDLGLDLDAVVEEPAAEEAPLDLDIEVPAEEPVAEETPVEDLGLDLDAVVEEPATEEAPLDLDLEIPAEEPVAEEAPVEDLGLDLDAVVEEPAAEEAPLDLDIEVPAEEPVAEEEAPVEEIVASEPEEEDLGASLDALLQEIGEPLEEDAPDVPAAEAEAEAPAAPEPEVPEEKPASEEIVIPDVGVDLTDPNRVMSAEEIEKLFASI